MLDPVSPRYGLPLLAVAQAQKEITHNEALFRIDAALHPVVEGSLAVPPAVEAADAGKCWLVESGAIDEWAGKAAQIACWSGENWRFLVPSEGMGLWNRAAQTEAFFVEDVWTVSPTIAEPTGGSVVDAEARVTIAQIMSYFQSTGRFAT